MRWFQKIAVQIVVVAILSLMLNIGCSLHRIEVSGRLVSYEFVNLSNYKLRYVVTTKKDITQKGIVDIGSGGDFVIKIKQEVVLPYWLIIKGFDSIPEASITENSIEISNNQQAKIDIGDVYIFNKIREWSNIVGPIDIEDIRVEWETDIPNVDYFKIKIVGRVENSGYFASAITISGIKENKFAFSSIRGALREEGTHNVGDIVVIVGNAELVGMYFLDIIAVRQIGERSVEVGRSNSEFVTIIHNERI